MEKSTLEQQQEIVEEVEAHENEESCTEEELDWYYTCYLKKTISGFKIQETETSEQKEEKIGTCRQNFINKSPTQMVD